MPILSATSVLLVTSGPVPIDAPQEQAPVPTIVVTGERVERSLTRTSSSVAVVTRDEIEASAAYDRLDQLLTSVPNLQLGAGSEGPTVRGQDTTGVLRDLPGFLGGTRPRTTVQVDGRPTGYNEFIYGVSSLWDVERVEVFRSPQTTTQGRNSIAGAIFITSADPTYRWEGQARMLAGNYDTLQASAALSGPIIPDQLAFRVAADLRFSRTSSFIADRVAGASPNHDDHGFARLRLLAEPRALPDLRVEMTYLHQESHAPMFEGVRPPFKARRDPIDGYGIFEVDTDATVAEIRYAFTPSLTVNSTFAWGKSFIQRFAPPGLGQTRISTMDWSGETVLQWRQGDALQVIAGINALRTALDQYIDVTALVGIGAFDDRQTSIGLFGEISLRPASRLHLTFGSRYERDRQVRVGTIGPFALDYDGSFEAWLPKATLSYDLSANLTAGFLVQRAYNPGGVTVATDTGRADTFEAERLWNFEGFVRLVTDSGRLSLRSNVFYYDVENAQRPQTRLVDLPAGQLTVVEFDNAPSAQSYGAELEVDWRPSSRLHVTGSFGLLATKIDETLQANDPIRGKEFQRSPSMTASATIDWQAMPWLRLSSQFRHNAGYFSDDANTPSRRVSGASVVDGRADVSLRRHLTLFAYVRNAFDDFYLTSILVPSVASAGAQLATAGDPREFGLGVHARF